MARMFRLPRLLPASFTPLVAPLLRNRRTPQARCVTALSNQPALEAAVQDLSRQLRQGGQRGTADLALVFCSTAYATDLQRLLPLLRQAIPSRHWIGWWCPCSRSHFAKSSSVAIGPKMIHEPHGHSFIAWVM